MRLRSDILSNCWKVLRQGRLHILPLVNATILAGAASIGTITPLIVFESFVLSLIINFVASAPNDYVDYNIDSESERKKITGFYVSDKSIAKYVAIFSLIIPLLTGLIIGGLTGKSLIVVSMLSVLYSVPPFRLKGRAPLDSICNALGVLFIFALGVGLVNGNFSDIISGAYWFSLMMAGGHAITAIPDMEEDRKEGLRTMPIMLGKNKTIALAQALILLALIFERFSPLSTSYIITVFFAAFILWKDWDEIRFAYLLFTGVIYSTIYLYVYAASRGLI